MSKYSDYKLCAGKCRYCQADDLVYQEVESYDEGYVDYLYKCLTCLKTWWVDGIDS